MHRLVRRGCEALVTLLMVASVVMSTTAATAVTAPHGCHYVPTAQQWACQAVNLPGPGTESAAKLSTGPGLCSWQGSVHSCHDNRMGWFDNQDGCYYLAVTPQPAYDSKMWEGH